MNREDVVHLFNQCEHPEHVEQQLEPILEAVDEGADLTPDEWQTVFGSLATAVESRGANWLQE